ncbi:putative vicilin GC72-A-like [Capsicum annuum]|nr:putative vicilin GC72-A-like [Capsicum annuum]KAF3673678.1 putative vicilin GC72-A-like [Capsicum annuum]
MQIQDFSNTPRDRLESLFGQQKQGIVIEASEEQIRAISQHASRSKGETRGPFNLLKESPLFGNRFEQFFEAAPEKFERLRDLDTGVGYMNINQGGMVLPHYNTRVSWLVMVVEGKGRFEMACPHLGSQSQRQGHYQKVQGHPLTIIANEGSNLRMAGFEVNGHYNRLNFNAGY